MPVTILRSWRSWAYGAITYAGHERLTGVRSRRAGAAAIGVLEASLGHGSVRVGGGAGGHLRLRTDYLPVDHAQGYALVRGVLEPGVQEALRRHVRPGSVVYDVGANIGFFSLLCARLTGPSGRVEAFEPLPHSATAIGVNAALNGLRNIAVHNVAVGATSGFGVLLQPGEHSWSHLADRGWHPQTRRQLDVRVVGLDELIAAGEIPPPDVVKIDVEGSEITVLQGLEATLRTRDVIVVCELHGTNREVLELLGRLGYPAENLDGSEPVLEAGPVHLLARRH